MRQRLIYACAQSLLVSAELVPALEPARPSMVAWSALFHNDDAYVFDVISSTKRKSLSVAVQHVLKRHSSRRNPCGRGPQGKKRRDPAPFSWEEHVARLNEKEFKQKIVSLGI